MKQPKVKEPVRLRSKPLKDGSESLYLDIYWNGIRQYEFLKLYLIPETTKEAKARNKETLAIATTLKSERIVALQRGEYNFSEICYSQSPLRITPTASPSMVKLC